MGGLCSKQISQGAQRILAEGVGSFILCFAILLSSEVLGGGSAGGGSDAPTFYAAGFTLASLAYGLEHIGGHFNPAVSLGAFLQGELSVLMLAAVILSQTVGGTLGGVLGNVLRATPIPSYNPPNLGKAFFVEAIFSGGLVLVSQSVGLFKNSQNPNSFFGVSLGFFLSAGVSSVSVISGGAFNPVVGMAVDFATLPKDRKTFDDIWLYWLAPFTGCVVASIFSRAMHTLEHDKWAVPAWFCRCRSRCCGYEEEAEEEDGEPGDDGRMPFIAPISEFVGTFFLTLVASLKSSDPQGPTKALSVGFMLCSMVYTFDHVCGADFNPAVTVGVALRMGRLFKDLAKILTIILFQFGGAFAASTVAFLLQGSVEFPAPTGATGQVGAVFFEGIWTAFLVYVVCAVMTDITDKDQRSTSARYGHSRSYHGLAIGFVIIAGILCSAKSGAGSGGCFNPAVGLATITISNNFQNFWIYIAGPFVGAVAGASFFTLLHLDRSISLDGSSEGGGAEAVPISQYTFIDDYRASKLAMGVPQGGSYGSIAVSPPKGAPTSPKQAFL